MSLVSKYYILKTISISSKTISASNISQISINLTARVKFLLLALSFTIPTVTNCSIYTIPRICVEKSHLSLVSFTYLFHLQFLNYFTFFHRHLASLTLNHVLFLFYFRSHSYHFCLIA